MSIKELLNNKKWMMWIVFGTTVVVVFLLGLLAASIMERRSEALIAYSPRVKIEDWDSRNQVWGLAYPREYESFLKTSESNFKSKYYGNAVRDALAEDPRLSILWAGYAFSKDYHQPRGHFYAISDLTASLRTGAPMGNDHGPQPNTCWTCKSPDVPRLMAKGGVAQFYAGKWVEKGPEIYNPIGCADCHEAKTMNLRISRPALIEAFARRGEDLSKAGHQKLRSLICAQCHVKYYFKGDGKYLTFPWDKGIKVEEMEAYFDEANYSDWTHALSRAPMLKAQHPDWEISQAGIHARRGVTCVDCHMPYVSEGGLKYTDHHVQSPLNSINRSCQTCHRQSEDELRNSVYANQDKVFELRGKVEDALVHAHFEAKAAWDAGATEPEMKEALTAIRHAGWRWDFAAAGHGSSFHAPTEVSRILGGALDKAGEARLLIARVLARHGKLDPVVIPDISTKDKVQAFLHIDRSQLEKDKKKFLETVVPVWQQEAQKREATWYQPTMN